MDNPANPVFFSTFDPFDTPAPPNNNINKSSSLTNSNVTPMSAGNANPDVNSNVLMPGASNVNNPPYFLSSPLDSPSINPYPLPRGDSHSSFTSPPPQPAPAYNSTPASIQSSFSTPTSSSSVSKSSPLSSPSLSSSQTGYPQIHQAPSPILQSQPQFQSPSPSPVPQSQPSQFYAPIPQSQPQPPPLYETTQAGKYFQPPAQSPPPQHQTSQPPQLQTQPQPSQPQPQPQPQTQSLPSSLPSFSTPTQHSPLTGSLPRELLDQMNKNINAVMTRLDSIENRLSFLEITTKEVLNNQRTISTQQRKLQDSVDTSAKMPVPMPQMPQPTYEEPRKPQTPAYPPAPVPTHSHISPPGPVIMPPPTSHSHHMPALVPVTHIPNNRGDIDYKPSSRPSQYDADLELAKKLQAEFDQSSSSSTSSTPSTSSNSNLNSSTASSYTSKPSQSSSQPKSGQQECPICQTRVAIADLEAHVEQHFEDEEAKRAPPKPGEKVISKDQAKAGFFAKLFGPKPEDEKKPNTENTPAPATTPATPVPYTHTVPAGYNQRLGYYPSNVAASPARAGMYPSYYAYPNMQNMQAMPNMQNMQNMQNMPRTAQPQQFLYYPNLDQAPQ